MSFSYFIYSTNYDQSLLKIGVLNKKMKKYDFI
ncbi:hypothetical protein PB1_05365 [Bacillus methanolicus PB1]|uniref:Uncharacterized protein n=1 Tax=Bacillus methanolicus PB1 TaxID=997296 RepID=I3DVR6_BACMT|nr:hypothetical protein PB1_12284 [Bacillus methanolicus PB1]EIJ81948.1 hypothetical protein PB1_03375 [Bacillus methanolicus PB1]EIJ82331.1 hypothetical protein PB1_05365 [Bacillus methanolicus PB1]